MVAKEGMDTTEVISLLKGRHLNDLNNLEEETASKKQSYQSIISQILMCHKLRTKPIVTNIKNSHKRYIPRDDENKELDCKLKACGTVHVVCGVKYEKSQIVERYYSLNKAKYDIVWKFNFSLPIEEQFVNLAKKINYKIERENFIYSQIPLNSSSTLITQAVLEFLEKNPYPYLLIFEDIHKRKNQDINIKSCLPKTSKRKSI